jgi:hypothetical protein
MTQFHAAHKKYSKILKGVPALALLEGMEAAQARMLYVRVLYLELEKIYYILHELLRSKNQQM